MRHIENDFELVIRVSKALEKTFSEDFGLTGLKLKQQIDRMEGRLDRSVINDMKILNQARNLLVHDGDVNSLRAPSMKRARIRFPINGTIIDRKQITATSPHVSAVRSKKPGRTPM